MRIALPLTSANEFADHYGAATRFVVYEVDDRARRVRRRVLVKPTGSQPRRWPQLLRAAGANLVLAAGMGARAQALLAARGLTVITGVQRADPDRLIAGWLQGNLVAGRNHCDHACAGDAACPARQA